MTRMFPFITDTRNPVRFKCPHECSYCWSQGKKGFVERLDIRGYQRQPSLDLLNEINPLVPIPKGEYIFLCDMLDLFAEAVPEDVIRKVLQIPKNNPHAKFLLLTKNPDRYRRLLLAIPQNCVCGATIETTEDTAQFSKAPPPWERYDALYNVGAMGFPETFVSIEPIMNFLRGHMLGWLLTIPNLKSVAVGYDNYNHHLPEPPLHKTLNLIEGLEASGITVYRKTLREAWNH